MAQRAVNWQFSIGGVQLTRFEVPETFDFGHDVKEAVHDFISETGTPVRNVHSQGAFSLPTTFEGLLFNANALERAQQLDALAVAEKPVIFIYGPLQYQVHIKQFKATVHHQLEVHYHIELTVISDNNGLVPPIDNGQSFDTGTQTFYDNATTAMAMISDPALPQSVISANQQVQNAFKQATPLKSATLTTLQKLNNFLNKMIAELEPYVADLQSYATLSRDLANLNASLIALQGFGLLQRNLLQLLGQNLSSTSSVLLSAGSSLFGVAAQYYPNSDPSDIAQLIAQANNLTDLFVNEPTTLVLPPVFS